MLEETGTKSTIRSITFIRQLPLYSLSLTLPAGKTSCILELRPQILIQFGGNGVILIGSYSSLALSSLVHFSCLIFLWEWLSAVLIDKKIIWVGVALSQRDRKSGLRHILLYLNVIQYRSHVGPSINLAAFAILSMNLKDSMPLYISAL